MAIVRHGRDRAGEENDAGAENTEDDDARGDGKSRGDALELGSRPARSDGGEDPLRGEAAQEVLAVGPTGGAREGEVEREREHSDEQQRPRVYRGGPSRELDGCRNPSDDRDGEESREERELHARGQGLETIGE